MPYIPLSKNGLRIMVLDKNSPVMQKMGFEPTNEPADPKVTMAMIDLHGIKVIVDAKRVSELEADNKNKHTLQINMCKDKPAVEKYMKKLGHKNFVCPKGNHLVCRKVARELANGNG